jgi:hypothetical protein
LEASCCGRIGFFSAVNEGLGQDLAIETTVHPLNYVQKFLNAKADQVTEKVRNSLWRNRSWRNLLRFQW